MNENLNEKSCQSQNSRIYQSLVSGDRLTALEALSRFGCMRLGARIFDIESTRNVTITRERVKTGNGKRVVQYSLNVNAL